MSSGQKVIKYLAMAFAASLAFSIISSIFYGIMLFTGFMDSENAYEDNTMEVREINSIGFSSLDINIFGSELIIKEGSSYRVETNNKYIKTRNVENTLYIEEDAHRFFKKINGSRVVIYIPSGSNLNDVNIENGAGSMKVDYLNTKNIDLDLGAGRVYINNLVVSNKADIDTGAGEVIIDSGKLNNLDLDLGVGSFKMNAMISGNSAIDQGVGEVNLNLNGSRDDYSINLNKGLGSVTVDGSKVDDDVVIGNGINKIDISGGVGSIKVNFVEN